MEPERVARPTPARAASTSAALARTDLRPRCAVFFYAPRLYHEYSIRKRWSCHKITTTKKKRFLTVTAVTLPADDGEI